MIRPKKRPEGLKPVNFGSDDSGSKASSKSSGSSGKGGGKSVDPSTSKGQKAIAASRTKKSGFGYYDDAGKYVPAYIDAFDGGGMNQQGTYFAGGPLSNILNVAKVAPLGATEGLVPREEIGYRDLTDMFDQGGPQASGGGFRGAGGLSGLGNIANMLAGNESERVGYYDEGGRFYQPPAPTPAPSGILNAVQNNDAPSPSYANMPMGEAGRGGVPIPEAPRSAAPSYLMPSSMQMPVENAPSAYNTAQTTYGQDLMLQMARDAVAQSMGVEAYAMLPLEEKQFREQQALNQIMSSMQ